MKNKFSKILSLIITLYLYNTLFSAPGDLVWKYYIQPTLGSPVIYENKVYVASTSYCVYALNALNGMFGQLQVLLIVLCILAQVILIYML